MLAEASIPSATYTRRSMLQHDLLRVIVPTAILAFVVLIGMLHSPDFQHWFVLPVLVCGALLSWDVLSWFRSNTDVFDPAAIVGLIGIYLFTIAPLLHVAVGHWMPYVEAPDDWRPWLGHMAGLNAAGLLLYIVTKSLLIGSEVQPVSSGRLQQSLRQRPTWVLRPERFLPLAWLAVALATVLQLGVYARFGGISGYVHAFSQGADEFTGLGLVFMFSESAPIIAMMLMVYYLKDRTWGKTAIALAMVLCIFILLKLAYGGLRGSRGHLIYGLFWAGCMYHVLVQPISRRMIGVGIVLMLLFMYAYGFYKSFGVDALDALDSAGRAELLDAAPRGFEGVLLGDLARADVQAFLLYRMSAECSVVNYDYALGSTYIGSASLLIPRSLWPDRPPTKVKPATDLLFGRGVFEGGFVSTFAFGLSGEAMLNFGPLGAPLSFAVLALGVVLASRWRYGLSVEDSRHCILPLFVSLTFLALLWDTDVLLFYTIKEGFVPALLLYASSSRVLNHVTPSVGVPQ